MNKDELIELKPVTNWSWESADGVMYIERRGLYYYGYEKGNNHTMHEDIYTVAAKMGCKIAA